jgi:hypothetical protein
MEAWIARCSSVSSNIGDEAIGASSARPWPFRTAAAQSDGAEYSENQTGRHGSFEILWGAVIQHSKWSTVNFWTS